MKRLNLFALLLCLLGLCPSLQRTSLATVDSEVAAVLQDRLMRNASLGVEVIRLGDTAADSIEVYGRDAIVPLIPASNLKLATTSAALDHFGPDFKFHTVLIRHGDDLVLVGDGDPTFGDADYLRKVGWHVTTVYQSWAAELKKVGVTSVRDVIVDDSIFDEEFFHPHWQAAQMDLHYMAQVAGMNLDANLVDVIVQPTSAGAKVTFALDPDTAYVSVLNRCVTGTRNGIEVARQPGTNTIALKGQTPARGAARVSTTIHDPPLYAASVLAETLSAAGVKVTGTAKRDRTARLARSKAKDPAGEWPVIGINATPIAAPLARANKDSVNLYAESFCKRLGADVAGASGSWENGTAAVGTFLRHISVPETEFKLDDGCGLSKENRISPHALATVLAYDYCGKNRDAFVGSLSIAGVDGTLEHRFEGTDLRRRVLGKSGFVEGVSTLSGLLHGKDGNWYAFSIMANGIPRGSNGGIKPLQERIVRAIDLETVAQAPAPDRAGEALR